MTFAADFAAVGVPALLDVYGQAVTYTPAGGAATPLTAIVGADQVDYTPTLAGYEIVRRRAVTIGLDPAASYGGIAAPWPGDTLTIDGHTYTVETVENLSPSFARLRAIHRGSAERTRPAYRKESTP